MMAFQLEAAEIGKGQNTCRRLPCMQRHVGKGMAMPSSFRAW